jgi:alkylhydroperoxidase/carboxymuconolactone decarboxylase family protein YurZ
MEWHLDQAIQNGATDEEIFETIDVSIEMGGGQAGAYARFVVKALDCFRNKNGKHSRGNLIDPLVLQPTENTT